MAVGDALRRLCEEVGWSYAVFWKAIGAADPVHLVWEDGYCGHSSCPAGSEASEVGCEPSSSVCTLVRKVMTSQVHVVGEGTIGRAAFTGNHQWIVQDAANDHKLRSEVAAEMNNQFIAGIQTIAIIPVLPRGVLQLGSTSVVMENTNFVLQYKKLCSQLNNRSNMASSSSVKNDLNQKVQSSPLNGPPSIYPAGACSKSFSGSPVTYEQFYGPDVTTLSSSTLANAGSNTSMLVAQRNGQAVKEHILYAPDMRFRQQTPYCDRRVESNTQSSVVSSGFISSVSTTMEKHPALMTNTRQFEQGNMEESSEFRNILLKSLGCRNPLAHGNTNVIPLHDRGQVSDFLNGRRNFDFLPEGTRVVKGNLYASTENQRLGQRGNSTSGMTGHKQAISYKMPQSTQFIMKMEGPKRETFQGSAALSSGSDIQVSSGFKTTISQENKMSSSDLIGPKKANEVNDPADVIIQGAKNVDRRKLLDISNERAPSLLMDPTTENDLFDIFGTEFHHLYHNVDNDLTWKAAKPDSSNRDAPESSVHLDTSAPFDSVDNEFPYSGIFSLTDSDQLLDAVISNVNPGGKQISGDSASCKTSLTDIPSSSYCRSKETKHCESSGAPPLLIKNELAVSKFVKQPSFVEKAEDGCLSQNNGTHKSQIRLWIESGQNMKCESVSASNSKGIDTPSKASRKRSRPGENPKPRPKDRQLIQDRIKELRELVPNGAKCSIDALLEKTIKHMLFLQSVTKHADNLKDSNDSKILGGENGPLKNCFEGGATWAFDVASQSMTCPIIVEDLDRPRQMLVEMLCEDRGIFLEITDFIKGLGLTILRGVMEARKNKIWARFTVEANRDVTRMEIFLSLMRLLEPSCDSGGAGDNPNNVKLPLGIVQYPVIPATGHLR